MNPKNDFDAYTASKVGLHSLTVRLAEKLRERNIMVTAINSGWVPTDIGGVDVDSSIDKPFKILLKRYRILSLHILESFFQKLGMKSPGKDL